jgi:hypothetical protein
MLIRMRRLLLTNRDNGFNANDLSSTKRAR